MLLQHDHPIRKQRESVIEIPVVICLNPSWPCLTCVASLDLKVMPSSSNSSYVSATQPGGIKCARFSLQPPLPC